MDLDINTILQALASNPNLAAQLVASLQAQEATSPRTVKPSGLPPIASMTAAQATAWDNGPNAKGGRYKLCFEVWNTPTESISVRRPNYKFNVTLAEYWTFCEQLKGSRQRESISQEFHDNITDVLDKYKDATDSAVLMGGLVASKKQGTTYFEDQWAFAAYERKTMVLAFIFLFVGGEHLDFTTWAGTDCKGNRLKAPAMYQSRVDLSGFSAKYAHAWVTQNS